MSRKNTRIRRSDYSLVGEDARLAREKGLAGAQWYSPPVPKDKMRELLQRRDGPAIRDTLLWFGLLIVFGLSGYILWGSPWVVVPFAIYGVLYASVSDSRWHECGHGTAFKTDWMNNLLYEVASFMVLRESTPWRWSHTRHHSDTIIVGLDPEIAVPRPANLWHVFLKFFNGIALFNYVRNILLHCTGKLTPEERTYIPEAEAAHVYVWARLYVLVYASAIVFSFSIGSVLPLMYIGLPNLYGAWLMVIYSLTQHAGLAENVLDHRLNTRTLYVNPIHRYLYWNMFYHVEHHLFPLVPYHALPKLHELIKADLASPYNGFIEAYREIVPALLRQVNDPTYYVKRKLPTPIHRAESSRIVTSLAAGNRPVIDGWIEVCDSRVLKNGDVLRFDHENKTYAIYRTADSIVYATDGICSHANGSLAEGLLIGTMIECPKHNGRFDIRDGSPQRLPARVAIKTYAVRESDGQLFLRITD